MNAKSFLIPLAAFAVTVTGASAFNSQVLERAGLSEEEVSAFEEARELRESGDREGARDVLAEAGITEETMKKIHEAMREERKSHHEAIEEAIENNDYEAFKDAIEGSPLADVITSQADFERFAEAHELMDDAHDIFEELGVERPMGKMGHGGHGMMHHFGHDEDDD